MSDDAKPAGDTNSNLKAVSDADQENARVRDERERSPDGMTASERAMSESAGDTTTTETSSGGPAFPVGHDVGMSLRDWFAGQAIGNAKLLAMFDEWAEGRGSADTYSEDFAAFAYKIADGMIAIREGGAA